MTTGDWFDEYEWDAPQAGDAERSALGWFHREAYRFRESDPEQTLALLAEGRALAEKLGEPWWVLHYDQQRVHALLHFKQVYSNVLDLAVRNLLQVRKPGFAEFPRPRMIHLDLVSAYLGIDPVGYAEPIRQALDYLDAETPAEGDDRYLLLGSQRQFALELGALEMAEACCQRSLELADSDPEPNRARHFLVFTYSSLCEISWRKRDWDQLEHSATIGEQLAREVGHKVELAGFWMWQALNHRRQASMALGERLYQRATRRLQGLGMPPDAAFRDAECLYHELQGDLSQSLAVREAELEDLAHRGRLARECDCLIQRAWLLHRLGRLTESDTERVKRAAGLLRQPGQALTRLERLSRGETP